MSASKKATYSYQGQLATWQYEGLGIKVRFSYSDRKHSVPPLQLINFYDQHAVQLSNCQPPDTKSKPAHTYIVWVGLGCGMVGGGVKFFVLLIDIVKEAMTRSFPRPTHPQDYVTLHHYNTKENVLEHLALLLKN